MAEFWQAYGNWILYILFFFLMVGHHFFMGHGGHARGSRGAGGHAHGPEDQDDQEASSTDEVDRPAPSSRHRHGGGCH
jgi:hypothetical protein